MKFSFSKLLLTSTLLLAACNSGTDATVEPTDETSMKDDVKVVAMVNGEAITQTELDDRTGIIAQGQGQQPTSDVVVNQLIDEMLIFQDAAAKGIEVTEEEVDEQYNTIIQNAGGAAALKGQLANLNLSPSALRKDLRVQLLIQKYLESQIDLESIVVTDTEVQTAYDEIAAVQEVPPFDESIAEQIRAQLVQQKQNELALAHVQTLRSSADINLMGDEEQMDKVVEEAMQQILEEEEKAETEQ